MKIKENREGEGGTETKKGKEAENGKGGEGGQRRGYRKEKGVGAGNKEKHIRYIKMEIDNWENGLTEAAIGGIQGCLRVRG